MANKLVTLATFPSPAVAGFVRSLLEEGGIRAFLGDETATGALWHLSIAIGWAKVQVADADVSRANEFLEECRQTVASLGPEEFESIATTLSTVDVDSTNSEPPDAVPVEGQADSLTIPSDDLASRAFRAAGFGLIYFPFMVYGMWLIGRLLLTDADLSNHASRKLRQACSMTFVAWLGIWILFRGAVFSIGIYQYPSDWSKDVFHVKPIVRSRILNRAN